jgi:hypothetical protein
MQTALWLPQENLPVSAADLERWMNSRYGGLIELRRSSKETEKRNILSEHGGSLTFMLEHVAYSCVEESFLGVFGYENTGGRVQFIHKTVKDFASKPTTYIYFWITCRALQPIWMDSSGCFVPMWSEWNTQHTLPGGMITVVVLVNYGGMTSIQDIASVELRSIGWIGKKSGLNW